MPSRIRARAASRSVVALVATLAALGAAESPSTPAQATTEPIPALGGARLRLIDIGVNVMTVAGASTASDDEIGALFGGHHDPARRGFTLQQAELTMSGAVDPYFAATVHILAGEEGFELEDASASTTALPAGLQVRAGYFPLEFGRVNPGHPHLWAWLSKPVAATRFLGPDGTRGAGARVSWLAPVPWYSRVLVAAHDAANETAVSFRGLVDEEDDSVGIAGRPRVESDVRSPGDLLWLARWENGTDLGQVALRLGVSLLTGPNASGEDADTRIYGADLVAKWTAAGATRGYPYLSFEAEAMQRDYTSAAFDDGTDVFDEVDLSDRGGHAQLVWGIRNGWAVGLRGELATGSGESDVLARADDPSRDDRVRIAPLVMWNPTHFSRLRLEYDYDRFEHQDGLEDGEDDAHSVWLGLEVQFGAHPAHGF